jgi:hypothetical protein
MHWGMPPRARARHELGAHCRRRASSSSACTDRCAAAASASAASAGRPPAAAHSAHSVAAASRPPQEPPQQAATASGFHACSAAAAAGPDGGHIEDVSHPRAVHRRALPAGQGCRHCHPSTLMRPHAHDADLPGQYVMQCCSAPAALATAEGCNNGGTPAGAGLQRSRQSQMSSGWFTGDGRCTALPPQRAHKARKSQAADGVRGRERQRVQHGVPGGGAEQGQQQGRSVVRRACNRRSGVTASRPGRSSAKPRRSYVRSSGTRATQEVSATLQHLRRVRSPESAETALRAGAAGSSQACRSRCAA